MSHGHSHGGGGGGGHGHSHGGPGGAPAPSITESKINNYHDDDDTVSRVVRPAAAAEPQTLEEACERGVLSVAITAVARGTDIMRTDGSVGATALHWAAFKGHMPLVRFLVDRGADLNFQDNRKQTPLFWAITENRLDVADFLLAQGADPYLGDRRNCDAFSQAAQEGSLAMVHLMHTQKPIKVDAEDTDLHNAFIWACYKGHKAIAEYLFYVHKMRHDRADMLGRTALHWAAREGHTEIALWLISLGLSPTVKDFNGMTPLNWAQKHNHMLLVWAILNGVKHIEPRVGTLQFVRRHWVHATLFFAPILFHALAYPVATRWVIAPIVVPMVGGFVGAKNTLFKNCFSTPIKPGSPEASIEEMIGAPKNAVEAVRGWDFTNYRDPGLLLLWTGVLFTQEYALDAWGVHYNQAWHMALLATIAIAATVCKLGSWTGFVEKQTVMEDPVMQAVEHKQFEDLRWKRIYRTAHHIRVPLRAFHCKELDTVIYGYDGWSLLLDAPVSLANRRSFVALVTALFLFEVSCFWNAWSAAWSRYCDPVAEFSVLRLGWNLFMSSMPCRAPYPDDSYWSYVLPTEANHNAFWLIPVGFVLIAATLFILIREFQAIIHGITTIERIHGTMPSTDGGLTTIWRNGHAVFSSGSTIANILAFLTGSTGSQWRTATAIPPPQTSGRRGHSHAGGGGCGCAH
jgi:ankyrin repeat protein